MVTIFSGFEVPFRDYEILLDLYPEVESICKNGRMFVGERLSPWLDFGDNLEIDWIREWSVTDKVRKTRFKLWEVSEKYINVYPKLFIL